MRCTWALTVCLAVAAIPAPAGDPATQPPYREGLTLVEAVRSALSRNPLITIQQRQVDISRGVRQEESGRFDTLLDWSADQGRLNNPLSSFERLQAEQTGVLTGNRGLNLYSYNVNAIKRLRSGVSFGPVLEMTRTTDNILNRLGVNHSRFSFQVNLPLLRDRGREAVTARETAAAHVVDASLFDLNQVAAETIADTAIAYWRALAASKSLDVIAGSEQRGRLLLDNVRTLIEADKVPRNEIHQIAANLADRSAGRIAAEQRSIEAKQALALAIGLTSGEMAAMPGPVEDFPDGESQPLPSLARETVEFYIRQALERRADHLASLKRREATATLRVSARNQVMPQVDLNLSTGFSGLEEGRRPDRLLVSPVTRVQGMDAILSLRYNFAPSNNVARGRLAQAEAAYDQSELRINDIERTIAASVVAALNGVHNGIMRLKQARESVGGYEIALEGERDKLRLGVGSLVDLLTVEDRLTNALNNFVSAQFAYAEALTRFRFATGSLIDPDRIAQPVDGSIFRVMPFQGEAPK
ncbi:MAG: TolC family protein [Bryobacteraceae bacterium]|nr:TolC family protein [Bryobacteraceae bacterium]